MKLLDADNIRRYFADNQTNEADAHKVTMLMGKATAAWPPLSSPKGGIIFIIYKDTKTKSYYNYDLSSPSDATNRYKITFSYL